MPIDRFFIAPYDQNSGLVNNVKPWLIPDLAFSTLENAYVWRGRVRKRFGSEWIGTTQQSSRLRINIGNTPGPINLPTSLAIGQMFSVGADLFYVFQLGANVLTYSTNPAATARINSTVMPNTVTFTGEPAATAVYFYPALPVMGLLRYEIGDVDNDPTIAFDTEFAYQYNVGTGGFERLSGGTSVWQGTDSNFFWGANWTSADAFGHILFVTNDDETDPNFMRYWDGATWTTFNPAITGALFLNNARILVVFKNRLIALNTWEGADIPTQQNYVNRARYSQVGSPLDVDAWRQDIPGRGNAIDAPTTEAIVTAQFLKDRLIVFFEKSTYELVYQGNQVYPFAWQKINTELGADSTFSQIPFDKVILGVDNIGIHACNGSNVERIDEKIPNEVFKVKDTGDGIKRIYGIRDYNTEVVYWTFPAINEENPVLDPFPNRILLYNYVNNTWAFNDDSITAFGYMFDIDPSNIIWTSNEIRWSSDTPWLGDRQPNFLNVIAGNQEGFVFVVEPDTPVNASVMQITNITIGAGFVTLTVIDHNQQPGDFIYIQGVTGTGALPNDINNSIFKVLLFIDANNFTIALATSGTYTGGGTYARVSQINIMTKEFNFYEKQGRNAFITKVDFNVDTQPELSQCSLVVNYFVSTSTDALLEQSIANGVCVGNGNLETFPYPTFYPYESNSARLWRPVYFQADGECIQFQITMTDEQMTTVIPQINDDATFSFTGPTFVDFQLNTIVINSTPTASRFQ